MAERLSDKLRDFLKTAEGHDVELSYLRRELHIDPQSASDANLRVLMSGVLVDEKIVRPSGKKDGIYHVIRQIKPVSVFGVSRERRPPYPLMFPKDKITEMEMSFAEAVVIREGDLILISGLSNFGKTALALNFCGENIDKNPVLMGNEYTTPDLEPTPRFLNRLDAMNWVQWSDENGDRFTLLPVREDYAEHVMKDKINIIDWINIETGEHYMIGTILDGIKKNLGKGIAIICIQKAEGAESGRGGQFTKDFTDCELLIDRFGESDVLLTIGKVKEYSKRVIGNTYAYEISQGVKIVNFREVKKCTWCKGTGYTKGEKCIQCQGRKFIDY
jgi:hypothetical protein